MLKTWTPFSRLWMTSPVVFKRFFRCQSGSSEWPLCVYSAFTIQERELWIHTQTCITNSGRPPELYGARGRWDRPGSSIHRWWGRASVWQISLLQQTLQLHFFFGVVGPFSRMSFYFNVFMITRTNCYIVISWKWYDFTMIIWFY